MPRSQRPWLALAFAAGAALAALLIDTTTRWPALLGFAAHDAQVRALRTLAPVADETVVLIGIDQATVDAIGLPLALWHRELGRVLETVAAARPRAMALDVVLPERAAEPIVPGLDRALVRGLVQAREAGGIVLALQPDAAGGLRPIYPPFIAAAGKDGTGAAIYPVEADGKVRRVDTALSTFVTTLARKAGGATQGGFIDYARGAAFDYVPLAQVLRWADAGDTSEMQRRFAGKVVLVGSVLPLVDRRAQPIALAAWEPAYAEPPGLLVHAQATRSLLGAGLLQPVSIVWILGLALLAALAGAHGHAASRWFTTAAVWLALLAIGAHAHTRGVFLALGVPLLAVPLAAAARSGFDAWHFLRERNRVARLFAGYVSPQVFGAVLDGRLALRGERRLAFLFADVRGFTTVTEATPADAVLEWLNAYYAKITPILHARGATIDSFRGDGLNAIFGAPQPLEDAALRALQAGRALLAAVAAMQAATPGTSMPAIQVGVGLAYGDAVFGDLGSADRRDFSAIGDPVNVAARLQDLTKVLGFPLLVSDALRAALPDAERATLVDCGEQEIKGHTPVRVWGWRAT